MDILVGDALQYYYESTSRSPITFFTRSKYYHTACVLGVWKDYETKKVMLDIIEAKLITGVKRKVIELSSGNFHVFRHMNMTLDHRSRIPNASKKYENLKYDFMAVLYRWWMIVTFQPFWRKNEWDSVGQYCSELYSRILADVGLKIHDTFPHENIVPGDISDSKYMRYVRQ